MVELKDYFRFSEGNLTYFILKRGISRGIILVVLSILVSATLFPQDAHAILYRRYWKAHRKMLQDYLINYKAGGTYKGCIRTTQNPDGLPIGWCLSMGKINKIMTQLDTDGYWSLKRNSTDTPGNPTARREYLIATTRQPYVMEKVVMYFEQVTDPAIPGSGPDTWLYGAPLTAEQAKLSRGSFLTNLSHDIINTFGTVIDGYIVGDEDIKTFAFEGDVTAGPKAKPEITESALDKIYAADRMDNFETWRSAANWTDNEITALNAAVARDRNVIDYAHEHGTTPELAKGSMLAMQTVLASIPGAGAAKAGGMALMRGAASTETSLLLSKTYQIGARQVTLGRPQLGRFLEYYTGPSSASQAEGTLDLIAAGSNRLAMNPTVRWNIPEVESILQDAFANSSHVFDYDYFLMRGQDKSHIAGWFEVDGAGLPQLFYNYRSIGGINVPVHEQIHLLRWEMSKALGFNSGLQGTPHAAESITDWTTIQVLDSQAVTGAKYSSRQFINPLVSKIAQKQGISVADARIKLFNIQFRQDYAAIDSAVGRIGFWEAFNNKLATYTIKEQNSSNLYALVNTSRKQLMDEYLASRADVYGLVSSL